MTPTDTTQPIHTPPSPHKPFALVLSGGGGRGLCHAGVLKALEHYGYRPHAIVGVSMGAIVGVTYALNPDWYSALVNIDTRGLPASPAPNDSLRSRIRALIWRWRMVQDMLVGWGIGSRSAAQVQTLLRDLTLGRNLEEGRLPAAVVATDLYSGRRVVLERGNAAEAAYASAALTGIFPPLSYDQHLLADGAYVDLAPIDVARALGAKVVIALGRCPEGIANDGTRPEIRSGEVHIAARARNQSGVEAGQALLTAAGIIGHEQCIDLGCIFRKGVELGKLSFTPQTVEESRCLAGQLAADTDVRVSLAALAREGAGVLAADIETSQECLLLVDNEQFTVVPMQIS